MSVYEEKHICYNVNNIVIVLFITIITKNEV